MKEKEDLWSIAHDPYLHSKHPSLETRLLWRRTLPHKRSASHHHCLHFTSNHSTWMASWRNTLHRERDLIPTVFTLPSPIYLFPAATASQGLNDLNSYHDNGKRFSYIPPVIDIPLGEGKEVEVDLSKLLEDSTDSIHCSKMKGLQRITRKSRRWYTRKRIRWTT